MKLILSNIPAVFLICFGVHGCSKGHKVYGWAVLAGFCLMHTVQWVQVKKS